MKRHLTKILTVVFVVLLVFIAVACNIVVDVPPQNGGEPTPTHARVTFNASGGLIGTNLMQYIYVNAAISNPPTPTRDGFNFLGWFLHPTAGGEFNFLTVPTLGEHLILHARWSPTTETNETVMAFHANGGTILGYYALSRLTENERVVFFAQGITPIREHFRFGGWYTHPTQGVNWPEFDIVNANITLYARWVFAGQIIFRANSGVFSAPANPIFSQAINDYIVALEAVDGFITPPTITRDNYTFVGWFTLDGTEWNFENAFDATTSLYARWN